MEFLTNLFGLVVLLFLVAAIIGVAAGVLWLWFKYTGWMLLVLFGSFATSIALPSEAPSELDFYLSAVSIVMFGSGWLALILRLVGGAQEEHTHGSMHHAHAHEGSHFHPHSGSEQYVLTKDRAEYYRDPAIIDQQNEEY